MGALERWRATAYDDRELVIAVLEHMRRHAPTVALEDACRDAIALLRTSAAISDFERLTLERQDGRR